MKTLLLILSLLLVLPVSAQVITPHGGLRAGDVLIGELQAAALRRNVCYIVTDPDSASDCSNGGGTDFVNLCCSNGTSWLSLGAVAAAGEANTASNLGGGLANFDTKSGVTLRFNSFLAADFDLGSNLLSIDDVTWLNELELNTESELEAQITDMANILQEDEIDASSELLAIMDDETGTGLLVFGTSPTIQTSTLKATTDGADVVIATMAGPDRGTPANGDLACLSFTMDNDSGGNEEYAQICVENNDIRTATRDGGIWLRTMDGSSLVDIARIGSQTTAGGAETDWITPIDFIAPDASTQIVTMTAGSAVMTASVFTIENNAFVAVHSFGDNLESTIATLYESDFTYGDDMDATDDLAHMRIEMLVNSTDAGDIYEGITLVQEDGAGGSTVPVAHAFSIESQDTTDDSMTVGIIMFGATDAITTGIDLSDDAIRVAAIALGGNPITHTGGTVTTTDLDIIDDGQIDDTDMAGEDFGEFTCTGSEDGCTLDDGTTVSTWTLDNSIISTTGTSASEQLISFQGADVVTPTDDDESFFSFDLESSSQFREYGRITMIAQDVTDTARDGQMEFEITEGGTGATLNFKSALRLGPNVPGGNSTAIFSIPAEIDNDQAAQVALQIVGASAQTADMLNIVTNGFALELFAIEDDGTMTLVDNQRQTFNPGADESGLNVGSHTADPNTPANGDIWYDSTANKFDCRENGVTVDCIPSGGAHAGTITWTGTSVLESGVAFAFGDGTDATITHTYNVVGANDPTFAYTDDSVTMTNAATFSVEDLTCVDCIGASDIADNEVNSEHYAAGSVDLEHMASASVDSDNIVDNTVSNVDIAATFEECMVLYAPSAEVQATDDVQTVWRASAALTLTEVFCETDTGTVTMDLQIDDGTPADVMGADLVCDATGESDSAGLTGGMADGDRLDFLITSVATNPTRLTVCVEYTYD